VLAATVAGLLVLASAGALVVGHVVSSRPSGGTPVGAIPTSRATESVSPSVSPTGAATPASTPTATSRAAPAPAHFTTLPPGGALPSDAQCAAWVLARPIAENRAVNRGYNRVTGQALGGSFFPSSDDSRTNHLIGARVDGRFTGTTHEILRWAACKWGIDEDIVAAQAVQESYWNQTAMGDWGSDSTACPPGHGLGADGRLGQCPQSWGILQNRYPFEQASWPGIRNSTAMNADTAYAIWRACYDGFELWLNDVDRGRQYAAGDAWGCVGRWFAGRWHTSAADSYTASVQAILKQRAWEQPGFQQA